MVFFNRGNPQQHRAGVRLPQHFARTLELYGRWEFDPQRSGVDASQLGQGNLQYEMWLIAEPNKTAFLEAVAQVAMTAGGWAVFGGERLIMNQVGSYPELTHPAYLALLDAATDFLAARGPEHLPAYYLQRRADRTRSTP